MTARSQAKAEAALLGRVSSALVERFPNRLDRIDEGMLFGVSGRVTCALAQGRTIGIDAWLAWCDRLGLDPVTGKPAGEGMPAYPGELVCDGPGRASSPRLFLWWFFAAGVHLERVTTHGWTVRDMARASGLSIATLSRLEHAQPVSVASVAAVCRTLGLHPHDYCQPGRGVVSRGTPCETRCGDREISASGVRS